MVNKVEGTQVRVPPREILEKHPIVIWHALTTMAHNAAMSLLEKAREVRNEIKENERTAEFQERIRGDDHNVLWP